ncbi:ANM_HP_G0076590.mRNA.1.CDS.1 [Saccharomyces cerevisiae]|nr:ANM_HP_G0139210.mRNA.1.CDS.1 [Saccharomyces cerevisiae]CAI5010157.1 ANM_HP_G0171250.mRNA.1.CDS.1 [Saccharomyces cerevisiae]CAI5030154.1 ANM_HP_G0189460.mRNA.1.CDS.1 [Saccharomyces cerevisiae]CAI5211397.1 ANM_HP_G0273500.mRNA.1.CDS.1 [Saccharomyces cerevisiae]CAI5224145.1 ANM_HP_G0061790.mRNA.1.CDS.1 [Saccharomyces cerevisiae]
MINYVNITCIIFSTRTLLVFDTSLYIPPPPPFMLSFIGYSLSNQNSPLFLYH